MEKLSESHSPVILSKSKDGYEKLVLNFNIKAVFEMLCCILFAGTTVFSNMAPFGAGFYSAGFSRDRWYLNYIAACIGIFFFYEGSPWVYIAVITLVTAILGVVDFEFGGFGTHIVTAGALFSVKLLFFLSGGFTAYDIMALILECAIAFASVYIFQKGFPVISDISHRSYVSSAESLCSMTVLALGTMAVSGFEPVFGFSISGVLSILLIYIFSLGGVNGGAVVLGVLLGTIGSLRSDSFAVITGTYAFGALLGSALGFHGKIAVVLGFVMANTASSIILTDASAVAVSIYDALVAAALFALIPARFCKHMGRVFSHHGGGAYGSAVFSARTEELISNRLQEMSHSFRDLSQVYNSGAEPREMGRDYIMSKFREVTNSVCTGCPMRAACFKDETSKGYRHMSKMLETSFKTGKISVHTIPAEMRAYCRRCDSFADRFNSVLGVIRLERSWLTKLNDSRRLVARQLEAVADTLDTQISRCTLSIDCKKEEAIRSELDKARLYPKSVVAEAFSDGSFTVTVAYREASIKDTTFDDTARVVSRALAANVTPSTPRRSGEDVIYGFYPALDYRVSVGYAMEPKNGEKKSGDTIKIINPDGKNVYAMLSDGMGSGESAARESRDAITLMEKFIRAGFDSDTTVRLINSSLLLKSSRDSFSTIDLCRCNLADASIMFTKLGAAASFIKSDGKISLVKGGSLPAGILREIEAEDHFFAVNSDTVIVMVSDGIGDISLKNKDLDGWLEDELISLDTSNPQIIASKLMKKAVSLQRGVVHDDMTIVALSIQKV